MPERRSPTRCVEWSAVAAREDVGRTGESFEVVCCLDAPCCDERPCLHPVYRSLALLWNSIIQQLADLGGRALAARECSQHPRSARHHSSTRRRSADRKSTRL